MHGLRKKTIKLRLWW